MSFISKTLILFCSHFFKEKEKRLTINRGFLWAVKIMLLFIVSPKFSLINTSL